MVVISKFRIELEGGAGEMHITIPYSVLEPIRDLLDSGVQSDKDETDERWTNMIHNEIYQSKVSVNAVLGTKTMQVKDIMNFNKGDIIPFELPELAVMYTENIPTFLVKLGQKNENYALKIAEVLISETHKQEVT